MNIIDLTADEIYALKYIPKFSSGHIDTGTLKRALIGRIDKIDENIKSLEKQGFILVNGLKSGNPPEKAAYPFSGIPF
ncbi:MAG: hypothetical protein JST02_13515 [Bacteroidetes bacterium]|nr:hypothetical protein [Bacteroidota bacterium]